MRHLLAREASVAVIGWLLAAASPGSEAADPSPAATSLSTADWRADLEFARAEMPLRHANLFHTLTPEQLGAAFDRLVADLDRLEEHEVIVRLAEIVAAVGDGHSRLTLPMDPGAGFSSGHTGTAASRAEAFRHLPLRLTRTGQGYVVTATDATNAGLLGSLVVEIDGSLQDATMRAEVSLPSLRGVRTSGASTVEVAGEATGDLETEASGASTIEASGVDLERLGVEVSGASRVEADGEASVLEADVSGASSLATFGLKVASATLDVSGASSAEVDVSGDLRVDASGASNVRFTGTAEVDVDASGGSTVAPA